MASSYGNEGCLSQGSNGMRHGASGPDPLHCKNVVPVNIKRRREHGNLLRSRAIFNIRSNQILPDPSFDRSSSLDEIWALAAMKFEERFTCEVFRNTFEMHFHHDDGVALCYK